MRKKKSKFVSKRDQEGAKLETESQGKGAEPIIWHRDDFCINLDGSSEIQEILINSRDTLKQELILIG